MINSVSSFYNLLSYFIETSYLAILIIRHLKVVRTKMVPSLLQSIDFTIECNQHKIYLIIKMILQLKYVFSVDLSVLNRQKMSQIYSDNHPKRKLEQLLLQSHLSYEEKAIFQSMFNFFSTRIYQNQSFDKFKNLPFNFSELVTQNNSERKGTVIKMNFIQNHPIIFTLSCVSVPILILLKRWFNGNECKINKRLDGKVVIVTGSNTGIGKQTAQLLAEKGARVVMACRNKEQTELAISQIITNSKIQNLQLQFMKLDLSSLASIHEFTETFKQSFSQLDVLVNNAAVGSTTYQQTEDGFQLIFGTNHIGTFALTLDLMDILQATHYSRIVSVSSGAHAFVNQIPNFLEAIQQDIPFESLKKVALCQLGNILFTQELQRKIEEKNLQIKAVTLNPGAVRTSVYQNLPGCFQILYIIFYPIILLTFKSTYHGAQTTINCVLEDFEILEPGGYYDNCLLKEASLIANDQDLAQNLFLISEDWTQIQF